MTRLSLFVALVLLPVSAIAAPGEGSDLDRLSETSAYARPEADTSPVGGTDELAPCGPGSAPCPPQDAPPVPLDGGLSLLALAGAGYAARRLRARRV
ncbi:MAG TPA: hypothetical protein VF594_00975 [Rubricoccaceae bacterium]|jgi:hypothetical protein